jgi:hypothetical protein
MIIRIDWTHLSIFRLPVSKAYAQEGGLNLDNIGVGDGPFSDGSGPLSELHALYALRAGSRLVEAYECRR